MEPAEYQSLVAQLEAVAARSPAALRWRVRGLVALGYGYVLAILGASAGVSLLLIVGMFTGFLGVALLKVLLLSGALTWVVGRALWVRIGIPEGIALPRGAAPKLEARLAEIRRALRAPRVDTILLTEQFNAAVTQIPRLGIFGAPRTYLILGLPLLYALGPRQLDAVLAHEFAHLSGAHPKLGLWVHRVGGTWNQLLERLDSTRSWVKWLFDRFFKWYVPRLNAYGFVMSRRDEFEADADAAGVTSPQAMAEALVALELRGVSYTRYFWPRLWQRAEHEAQAPAATWSLLPATFRGNDDAKERRVALAFALKRRSIADDTHPSLRERLHALGALTATGAEGTAQPITTDVERLIVAVEESAAAVYLGPAADSHLAAWEGRWKREASQNWAKRHNELKAERARINVLKGRLDGGETLTPEEMWELANRSSEVDGVRASAELLRRAAEMDPKNAVARFVLGSALLEDGDERGVPLLREAMAIDPAATVTIHALLRGFAAGIGDRDAVHEAEKQLHVHSRQNEEAARERQIVFPTDTVLSARLPDGDVQRFAEIVRQVDGVKEIWVARKKTVHEPTRPFFVVLVFASWRMLSLDSRLDRLATQVFQRTAFEQDADVMVLALKTRIDWLRVKMKKADAARIGPHGRLQ